MLVRQDSTTHQVKYHQARTITIFGQSNENCFNYIQSLNYDSFEYSNLDFSTNRDSHFHCDKLM